MKPVNRINIRIIKVRENSFGILFISFVLNLAINIKDIIHRVNAIKGAFKESIIRKLDKNRVLVKYMFDTIISVIIIIIDMGGSQEVVNIRIKVGVKNFSILLKI